MELGPRIRKIRLSQKRTLVDVASACGLTKSFLSKIETGKSIPTVATLTKVARALGVKVSMLIDDHDRVGTVFTARASVDNEQIRTDKGYSFHGIATERIEKLMEPYIFVARRGEVQNQWLSHEGEEFIYVLEGAMKYRVGREEYILGVGDSLYFDSLMEHELQPISAEVRYVAVFSSGES